MNGHEPVRLNGNSDEINSAFGDGDDVSLELIDDAFDADALDGEADAPPADGVDAPVRCAGDGVFLTREEEQALVAAAQLGDRTARDKLVQSTYRSITWVAKRYRASGVPLDDLVNEGAIGVLTAVDRFDPARGTRFETYARWWILDAMRTCVMRQSRTVRLPANVVKEIGSIDRLLKASNLSGGETSGARSRTSIIDRVAQQLRRSGNHVEELLALREPALPLESIAERAHEESFSDGSPSVTRWSPEAMAAMNQILGHLTALMTEALAERERRVLVARYGLDNGVQASLEELGAQLGLTAERVRQIQNEAIAKLRARFIERRLLPAEPGARGTGDRRARK